MKIALINDTHFGVRNDSGFFLEHSLNYYENVFFPYIIENNITEIIHLGDFFDRRKYINFNTLKEVRKRFLEKIPNNCNFHIIIGNHDTYFKNTNEVNSLKELFRGYSNISLYDTPTEIEIDGLKISLIPWINDTNSVEYVNYITSCSSSILMGHLEIKGFEVISGVKHEIGLNRKVLEKFEMVISGHFHMKQSNKNIHYLGAQYQLNFGDVGCIKGYHVLDTATRELEFIENESRLFHILRYDDSILSEEILDIDFAKYTNSFIKIIVKCKSKPFIFDKFIDKIYGLDTQEISIVDDFTEKTENINIDISEDTISLINKEIDTLHNDLNKDKLKVIIKNLYMEALLL